MLWFSPSLRSWENRQKGRTNALKSRKSFGYNTKQEVRGKIGLSTTCTMEPPLHYTGAPPTPRRIAGDTYRLQTDRVQNHPGKPERCSMSHHRPTSMSHALPPMNYPKSPQRLINDSLWTRRDEINLPGKIISSTIKQLMDGNAPWQKR